MSPPLRPSSCIPPWLEPSLPSVAKSELRGADSSSSAVHTAGSALSLRSNRSGVLAARAYLSIPICLAGSDGGGKGGWREGGWKAEGGEEGAREGACEAEGGWKVMGGWKVEGGEEGARRQGACEAEGEAQGPQGVASEVNIGEGCAHWISAEGVAELRSCAQASDSRRWITGSAGRQFDPTIGALACARGEVSFRGVR
eukprot:616140-Prorocentrum_minimum.AAC.3